MRKSKSKSKVTRPEVSEESAQVAGLARVSGRDGFLTPVEAASRLLVAPVTVRLWASKGLLPAFTTPGGHRRYRTEDIDALIARHQPIYRSRRSWQPRVLIIDDDAQFVRYLTRLINVRAPHVSVDAADSGFAAGLKCESLRPDIVTLDLQMPDMDGFDVCVMLRNMFGKSKPRIVALTAFASRKNVARIVAAGADCCVSKTVPADLLMRELKLPHAAKF